MDDVTEYKVRKPWVAGLLTVVVIGLGQIYSGRAGKGVLLFLGSVLLYVFAMGVLAVNVSPALLAALVALGVGYFLFCLIDSVKAAKEAGEGYALKRYNRWYVYLLFWALTSVVIQPAVSMALKAHVIQAYKIPAASMLPTLEIGDHILVNKRIYKTTKPRRGDMIVFEYPKDASRDFVKRLVGMEGDVIELRDKQLYLNGVLQEEDYVIHTDGRTLPATVTIRDNFGPVIVPEGAFFVMGDNRDNSHDSRFWGFVASGKVRGKVMHIYWSWDRKGKKVRWGRVGKKL